MVTMDESIHGLLGQKIITEAVAESILANYK